ncbi:MAG: 2-oxoacid:acceptor oxidoreductase subunit alpha [Chloroflexi bacterium]|nr:2-oxoacid:acceptor oxidoreductase subunit alpha [Chloroflexota bacterium]
MSPTIETEPFQTVPGERIVNDFSITFSTVNGSGSQTANTTLLRALFKMGIPVSGKNIFPSNIKGLPTWYTLRLSREGWLARVEQDDIVVAMNASTIQNELDFIVPGGVLFYADDIQVPRTRSDVSYYPMPIKQLSKDSNVSPKMRDYVANMVYVGILAQMLGIDLEKIRVALDFHFKGKQTAVDGNMAIIQLAVDWARQNLVKTDRYFVEPMNGTHDCIMSDGNTAAALGSIYGGVQFLAWYPITPASSLPEALHEYLPMLRKEKETKRCTYAVVQAEDELAAIGMSIGAGWAGLRAMTATSGPGLSLMSEYLGLAYFSEVPVVVWDVQRVGPSTGLPTRTAQGDLTQAFFHSHGDCQFIILIPGSINECFDFGWKAFDIAEHYQTPVIVLSDLDLGMNQWMSKPFDYPDEPIDRGKILWEQDLQKMIEEHGKWGRYWDVDGDHIPYRTVMGNQHPAAGYFARGTGHDEFANYSETGEDWQNLMARLDAKYQSSREALPGPIIETMAGSEIAIISMGSAEFAIQEARTRLKDAGIPSDYLRVRSIPFSKEIADFARAYKKIYVVELNRDGQLKQLLTLDMPDLATRFIQLSHLDGLPLTAKWVKEQVICAEGK